jgi:methyltransferase (TIGR00027 family)
MYYDPYAYAMYPGSFVQAWMGPDMINKLYSWMGMTGFQEIISVRTKWLDEMILQEISKKHAKQLIILGAGYDTRGFRLDLPTKFAVWEVDQPEVQQKKLANLQWLVNKSKNDDTRIQGRMNSTVQFVPVNFNEDSVQEKLQSQSGFQSNQPSIMILEGVTQYIPKTSTADTLKKIKTIVALGSILLITYVDQNVFDDPSQVASNPNVCERVVGLAGSVGEPWISGWSPEEFAAFLKECGYDVISDTTTRDYNESYLGAMGRKLEEKDVVSIERFVMATVA